MRREDDIKFIYLADGVGKSRADAHDRRQLEGLLPLVETVSLI